MKYLMRMDVSALDLTDDEEAYLDKIASHEAWCRKNQGKYGRKISVYEAIGIFKENVYEIAIDLASIGDIKLLELIKDKSRLEFREKIQRAKAVPITSLITTPIVRNKTLCPFHSDTKPSMHIYNDSNTYYCFTCGHGGDTINYIMGTNKCNFVTAVNLLT